MTPGGALFPCAYYSRKLNPAERNYTIREKELFVIKVAFETWRHHLEGGGIKSRADALSRKPEYSRAEDKLLPRTVLPIESFAAVREPIDVRAWIQEAQQQDGWVAQRKEEVGPNSPWTVVDGLLHYRDRLYVPGGPLRGLILSQCHDNPAAGHFGLFKTLNLVSLVFVVVDMLTKMAHFIPCRGLSSARTTALMFIQQVFHLHGLPEKILIEQK
ncbi:uncharacterized protein LOC120306489 [Crotalus tigris]|uniref:uncharacterized protein LOC120306489 n=1 Tax=Crotalus tigris TaxID=88082 RepID=UPI00192FB0A7|nr:uncharacterized protein LOC120306489 [Crotalus tigris]